MVSGSLQVARIFGIPIYIHYTWLIIFGLLSWSLATGYFPRVGAGLGTTTALALGIATAILFFAALLLHELAHSFVAVREGLPVRGITLFIFGGVAQMAKEPRRAGAEFRMAIAGPLMSVLLGGMFAALFGIGRRAGWPEPVLLLCQYLGYINVAVAVFNLVPAFPLDGGRILRSAIWHFTGSLTTATRIASAAGVVLAYVMMGVGVVRIMSGVVGGGIWLMFIGWFVLQAAQAGYQQVLLRQALRGVEARDVMREEIAAVPPDLTLTEFVNEHLMRTPASEFCVMDDGRLLGLITLNSVKRVERDRWDQLRVSDAMTTEAQCPSVRASQNAFEALMLLGAEHGEQVVVREGSRLIGTITRQDLLAYVRNRLALST
jgi:Zn-dependent protease/predicted transcriptional regulator